MKNTSCRDPLDTPIIRRERWWRPKKFSDFESIGSVCPFIPVRRWKAALPLPRLPGYIRKTKKRTPLWNPRATEWISMGFLRNKRECFRIRPFTGGRSPSGFISGNCCRHPLYPRWDNRFRVWIARYCPSRVRVCPVTQTKI
jgi:hypothetical protein